MTQSETLVYISTFNLAWIIFLTCYETNICVCDSALFFGAIVRIRSVTWVGREGNIYKLECNFSIKSFNPRIGKGGSQTWRKLKRSRLVCVCLLGLWSPFRLTLSLFELPRINKIPATVFPSVCYSVFVRRGSLWSQSSTCPVPLSQTPLVKFSALHYIELTYKRFFFFCETGFVHVWHALWF